MEKVSAPVVELEFFVDYSRTIKEVMEVSNHNWTAPFISEEIFHSSVDLRVKKEKVSAKLFYFDNLINSNDAIFEMKKDSYRPATLAELLAFANSYPELQKERSFIVALGSAWKTKNDDLVVPYLGSYKEKLKTDLRLALPKWPPCFDFLAVRV